MTRSNRFKTKGRIAGAVVLAGFVLSACSGTLAYRPAIEMLDRYDRVPPRPGSFVYCYDYGCSTAVADAALGENWTAIEALFKTAAPSPAEERQRMAEAVALFEQAMGRRYGTDADKGGTFENFGSSGQLDCIDEALNTTTLLKMLENQGLLAWHDVSTPIQRSFTLDRWLHSTAVVVERDTAAAYAIDSWFQDNGQKAEVVPVEAWFDGWVPG
jgi:hypothetical protein